MPAVSGSQPEEELLGSRTQIVVVQAHFDTAGGAAAVHRLVGSPTVGSLESRVRMEPSGPLGSDGYHLRDDRPYSVTGGEIEVPSSAAVA